MTYIESTPEVSAICAKYFRTKNPCAGCPLFKECNAASLTTVEAINERTLRMNEAAKKVNKSS